MKQTSAFPSGERPPSWSRPDIDTAAETIDRDYPLESLSADRVFQALDLDLSDLADARRAVDDGRHGDGLCALLDHYRRRFPAPEQGEAGEGTLETAAKITRHIFQWGPYEEARYGEEVDWNWDPHGDIEWVAAMYRFYWSRPLAEAWSATRDETYARTFVDLALDWIGKHPLQKHRQTHPTYTHWQGYAWLDLQTGIRAYNLCAAFKTLVHSEAVTPDFLATFLASLYDHQVKTEHIPMGVIHNKAIFEQRGAVEVATDFPEFADTRRWLELSRRRATGNLLAQTTADGVQREWSFGYHMGVLRDAVIIAERLEEADLPVSEEYSDRVRRMHDYVLGVATPDLGSPMFGDGSRPKEPAPERSHAPLHSFLVEASERYGDPQYAALANLDAGALPDPGSCAFPEAGMYVMRSGWGPEDIYLALHCSPKAISSHDQPDNGTFELCAFGRWLMPDTGFFTYGHDPEGRAWHRRTAAHQTLTLDGADSADAGGPVLWHSDESGDVLVVENDAYEGLVHRRTVWFPGRRFFVFLDEAIGQVEGQLDLHFQLAAGEARFDPTTGTAHTTFDDANVLIAAADPSSLELVEEEGWWAWHYGHREPRPAFCYRHTRPTPAAFLTLVIPFKGSVPPGVSVGLSGTVQVGDERFETTVSGLDGAWQVGRDLALGSAWCRPG
ncbi:alginate lyase family protein [Candidatus Latescibacterota bacterium]